MLESDHDLLLRVSEQLKALNNKVETYMSDSQRYHVEYKTELIAVKQQTQAEIVKLETDVDNLKSDTLYAKGALKLLYVVITIAGVLISAFAGLL